MRSVPPKLPGEPDAVRIGRPIDQRLQFATLRAIPDQGQQRNAAP